jgi:hypothetical protein
LNKVSKFTIKQTVMLIGLLVSLTSQAADTGIALKADKLKIEPFNDAKTTGTIIKNETLEIVAKKGAWLQVKSKNKVGWVRILTVKRNSPTASSASTIAGIANGRVGSGKIVSTTGIRGLSADDLKNAQYDDAQIQTLESYTVNNTNAEAFAKLGTLKKQTMTYLKSAK